MNDAELEAWVLDDPALCSWFLDAPPLGDRGLAEFVRENRDAIARYVRDRRREERELCAGG